MHVTCTQKFSSHAYFHVSKQINAHDLHTKIFKPRSLSCIQANVSILLSPSYRNTVEVPILTEQWIEKVSSFKYLGVNVTDDLTWSTHISVIASKARKILGLLYRQFSTWSPPEVLQLYRSLVRPHLEYASQVWNPHLIKDIGQLETSQKFALKVCFKQWDLNYSDLHSSNLPTLSHGGKYLGLC